MKNFQLLDVSLRDGGHRTKFYFDKEHLQYILPRLDCSGIDYIEIGYRNGSLEYQENIGPAGLCHDDFIYYCKSLIKRAKVAVMVHCKNIRKEDLIALSELGVNLVRFCVVKGDLENSYPYIEFAKQQGLNFSINFTRLSYYAIEDLHQAIDRVKDLQPDMIYLADSNGSLFPDDVSLIFNTMNEKYDIPFGFHAHNNLGLAQSNVIAALNSGASIVDASLSGMGKGIGNLAIECFLAYCQALKIERFDLNSVLEAANYVRKYLGIGHEEIAYDEFLRGIHDLTLGDLTRYKEDK